MEFWINIVHWGGINTCLELEANIGLNLIALGVFIFAYDDVVVKSIQVKSLKF